MKLLVTYEELQEIVQGDYEQFELIKENLPTKYKFDPYHNKSRYYTSAYFKDTETDACYYVEYAIHNEFGLEFPEFIQQLDENIEFVNDSILNPEEVIESTKEIEPVEPVEKSRRVQLHEEYLKIEKIDFKEAINTVPLKVMRDLRKKLNSKSLTYNELFINIFEVAIPYKLEFNEFKTFLYSKKKHLGTIEEQIAVHEKALKKLSRTR